MDDIVAVEVLLDNGNRRYFLTWGRIQDTVDPTELEQIVVEKSNGFHLAGKPVSARVCYTLQEARDQAYFFECLFAMSQRPIPFGNGYGAWRSEMDKRMRAGRELYYLGVEPPGGLENFQTTDNGDDP